jgi:hypothetical protein
VLDQCGQLGLGIEAFGDVPRLQQPVVPVVVPHELAELEWVAGERRVHRAQPAVHEHAEGLAVAAAPDLEVTLTAHEVVVVGIQREQHAEAAVRLGVDYYEVTVRFGVGVHPHTVALPEVALFAQPDLDGRLLLRGHGCRGGRQAQGRQK